MRRVAVVLAFSIAMGCVASQRRVEPQAVERPIAHEPTSIEHAIAHESAAMEGPAAPVAVVSGAARSRMEPLPFSPRFIRAGDAPSPEHPMGTLLMWSEASSKLTLDVLDLERRAVTRSVAVGSGGAIEWARSSDRLYLLISVDDEHHRLVALDADLRIVAESVTRGATRGSGEDAEPAKVEPGKAGVRVTARASCPQDEEGCVWFETHRRGDLAVVARRSYPHGRLGSPLRPGLIVPMDQGASDAKADADGPGWTWDPARGELVASDGRSAPCAPPGSLISSQTWMGARFFVLTRGCCGGPRGGLFECEAPK